jgi:hypothetical protein
MEPHDAEAVMANGYGDCKDHAVLLHALLAAKGIASEMALINLGNEMIIGEPPTISPLNHVITYIPEFDVFVDSTIGVAPFGELLLIEQGKPVVMLGGDGPAVRHTPVEAGERNQEVTRVYETMSDDASIVGNSVTEAHGMLGVVARMTARALDGGGRVAAMQRTITSLGENGNGDATFAKPNDPAPVYRIDSSFHLDARPERLDGDAFRLFNPGLSFVPGEGLLGDVLRRDLPAAEATMCVPGTQSETISLTLPAGRTIDRMPRDVTIEQKEFSYTSRWTLRDGVLTVRREAVSRVAGPVCEGDLRGRIAKAAIRIRADLEERVALKTPNE